MVSWFCKWFLIAAAPGSVFFSGYTHNKARPHPMHISTTEINHNAADKTLEINCRVFPDDFESALLKQFRIPADLSSPSMKKQMDTLVKKYLVAHLQLRADGKSLPFTYIGFENDKEAVNVFARADHVSTIKKIQAVNTVFHDIYDDQVNIMHVIVGGNRKSYKLDYPDKQAQFVF